MKKYWWIIGIVAILLLVFFAGVNKPATPYVNVGPMPDQGVMSS